MRKVLVYLIFIILACSQIFALTVSDLKPNDRAGDMQLSASYPLYKEEETSALLMQPFESYKDVEAHIFVYDSPNVNASEGYDLIVILEEWKSEAQAKHRFDEDFSFGEGFQGFTECSVEFKSRRIKKCEKSGYPQWVYVFYYQNFLIRIQPHYDHDFTTYELFYLSFDAQSVIKNILAKISLFEKGPSPPERELVLAEKEILPEAAPAEQPVPEEVQPGFFSRNKYYILGVIGLCFVFFWMYKTRKFLGVLFVIILGLIILNRYTVFTKEETIGLVTLWIIIYFLVYRFYRKKIKKKK